MIAASGGRTAAASSASAAVAVGDDLEAGVAQHDLQRAQDLRLVVADEHARCGRAHPAASRTGGGVRGPVGSSGNSIDERRPLARAATRPQIRPPLASTKPRAIASPRPGAAVTGAVGPGAVERLEDPLALGRRDPGAAVDDAHEQPPADRARADRDRVAARVPDRVLEQVRERALELGGVGAHEREVAVEREREVARRPVDARRSRLRTTSSIATQSRRGSAAPASQPREVEQLVDEPRQPRAPRS